MQGYISILSWRGAVTAVICAVVALYLLMKRFDPKTYKKEQEEAKEMPMLN